MVAGIPFYKSFTKLKPDMVCGFCCHMRAEQEDYLYARRFSIFLTVCGGLRCRHSYLLSPLLRPPLPFLRQHHLRPAFSNALFFAGLTPLSQAAKTHWFLAYHCRAAYAALPPLPRTIFCWHHLSFRRHEEPFYDLVSPCPPRCHFSHLTLLSPVLYILAPLAREPVNSSGVATLLQPSVPLLFYFHQVMAFHRRYLY